MNLTPLQIRYITIALILLLVIVVLATLYLPRKVRLGLYTTLLVGGLGTWGYGYYQINLRPYDLAVETYISGLEQPVDAIVHPVYPERILVLEKSGTIRLIENDVLVDTPFLDLVDKVESAGTEQGLLSMAFDPNFVENGYFYLYYTVPGHDTELARYRVSEKNSRVADSASARLLLQVEQPSAFHNGGFVTFGPDGYLYLSIGDGGDNLQAQNVSNLLGTMIRLDVRATTGEDPPYLIPPDNPFVDVPSARPEIWAYGLRNPWRFDFDSETGALFMVDVGDAGREEVNYQPPGHGAGANYGWPWFEGSSEGSLGKAPEHVSVDALTFPVAEYHHLALGGCSITGGVVYHGTAIPDLAGKYLYGDYCTGFIWSLELTGDGEAEVETILQLDDVLLTSFLEDSQGELYLVDFSGGKLHRLVQR